MPELPEVETTRRGLIPSLKGRKILGVTKRRNKIRIAIPEDFEKRIIGCRALSVDRRAKYLQIPYFKYSKTSFLHLKTWIIGD